MIIAPVSAPQIHTPPLGGVEHPLAGEVFNAVRQRGPAPVGLWKIINLLANAKQPDSRTMRRCWWLHFWGACRELFHADVLFRHGSLIASSNFATTPMPRSRDRRPSRHLSGEFHLSPAVGTSTSEIGGSNPAVPRAEIAASLSQAVERELLAGTQPAFKCADESESAPAPEIVSDAARTLARLPRNQPRKLTGWLHGQHCWRGRLLALPDGEVAPLLWCSRGRVLLRNYRDLELPDFLRWGGRREHDVRFHKCPEAVLLGSRKAGVKERPSTRKQQAAQRNGAMPARAGSRRRGRPKLSVDPQRP